MVGFKTYRFDHGIMFMEPRFVQGCSLERFKDYYREIVGEVGETELRIIGEDPRRLIVWLLDNEIVGHAIWHPSNTVAHPNGEPRECDDRRILEEDLGVAGDFVELHEVWLREDSRGRGFGSTFFDYFESMVKEIGYRHIVYYADHPAALAICRARGYREGWGVELDGISGEGGRFYVLAKELT